MDLDVGTINMNTSLPDKLLNLYINIDIYPLIVDLIPKINSHEWIDSKGNKKVIYETNLKNLKININNARFNIKKEIKSLPFMTNTTFYDIESDDNQISGILDVYFD